MTGASQRNVFLRIAALFICALLAVGTSIPVASAADRKSTVKAGFFAMDGYHVEDDSGTRSGYGYEFLNLVARYSDLRFDYVGYEKSWDEMQSMLLNGEIDILTSAQKTPEREELYAFSESMIGKSSAILTVKAGDTRYNNGNYSGIRVGMINNNSRNAQLDSFMISCGYPYTAVYYDSMEELTSALQEGKDIDAALTSNLRRTENEWIVETMNVSPFYVIVRKEDAALIKQVNEAIDRMDSDVAGWRTTLFNKYYSAVIGETAAYTADERAYLDSLKESGRVFTVTMNPDSAPYSYFENGEAKGIIPTLFAEVAQRMGISYEMKVPADRAEYYRLCNEGVADIILDGINDTYTTGKHGFEISDFYYTAPLAVVTRKARLVDVKKVAQPEMSVLNESYFSDVFTNFTEINKSFSTCADAVKAVMDGRYDGVVMPYYCASNLASEDASERLQCLILPSYERAFAYAVKTDENYLLLTSLNKTVDSLSDNFISSAVVTEIELHEQEFTVAGFIRHNPILSLLLAIISISVVVVLLYFINANRTARREVEKSRRMERYIGYMCDMYDEVLEVDVELKKRRQYRKRNGVVEIEERNDFNGFDMNKIHPDDIESSLPVFASDAIRQLASSGKDEQYVECRMLSDDGEYRWHSFHLKLIPGDREHPCGATLLVKNVDELHRERQSNHEALLNALDAANAASRSKSAFLSGMSHEIRTPLNAMIGYMTIASGSIDDREKLTHCIEAAGVSARHLLSVINNVLDISSMESGKLKLNEETFDLKEQLSVISTAFYQQCKQKNIRFDISVDGLSEEWVVGDSVRVNQILLNLMSNAVKFTEKGRVSLIVSQTAMTIGQVFIKFVVKDTGIGMSKEFLNKLFKPFEQENTQATRKISGTGLGMPITLNLVNIMGGKIDVVSEQGEGTVFTVTIPFKRADVGEGKSESRNFSNLKVLIVDDHVNECEYIQALLKRCGVRSKTVTSGRAAIRMITNNLNTPEQIDLCIMDWNMPGLNGAETTRLIHQKSDPNIPVIIATAYDITEFENDARDAGVTKIVTKPLFQSTLLDLLVSTYGKYKTDKDSESDVPDLTGMHVLLAEDNEMNIEVAVDLLDIVGVKADIVRNGSEAVEAFLANADKYDAILMDVQMPVMDGYEATRAIRASKHTLAATMPIVAITADAFAENVANALASGMNDHISKPIETVKLFAVLKKYFDNKR